MSNPYIRDPEAEAEAEFVRNVGWENEHLEWLATPNDTWVRNPHYTGEPGPHPEGWQPDTKQEPAPVNDEIPF